MGQNSEEAAELVATIRGEHVVMKNWFNGSSKEASALRAKYGPYPGLWKEVLNWPGWKEARKSYLNFVQTSERSSGNNESNNINSNDRFKTESSNNNDDNSGSDRRKRRSRWGVAGEDGQDDSVQNSSHSNKQRRSRWGRDPSSSSGVGLPSMPPTAPPLPKPLPGLNLPGLPANLPPQQQEEMRGHQNRLKEINHRLENLDQEAARVDALPRGHRERSPSPPPGMCFF